MPAIVEAIRGTTRPETPVRLRLWVGLVLVTAAALLAATSLTMARVAGQVRTIGDDAAPQAATAADLYFALSDMDAQVARLVLTRDSDELAADQIDALGTYRERSRQVDADLQRVMGGPADDAVVLGLLDDLAVYRERVWQALTAGDAAAGYYTQATNVLHLDLLPAAQELRQASERRLSEAYASKKVTEVGGMTLTALLGALLFVLLLVLQVWLARRFRRVLNPALIIATVLTVALVGPALAVLAAQQQRLADARSQSLVPFLALSGARAVSYDAAADTSRFLISDNLDLYARDFIAKAGCLATGGGCGSGGATIDGGLPGVAAGPDVSPVQAGQVADRWAAYRRDHERITALATAGRTDEAVAALTGIRRGDAAFDFTYYDAAVAEIADRRRADFDAALAGTSSLLTGWTVIPVAVLGPVLLLVLLAVRRRFAEYR